jgi:molybdopterin synthase sulfur carrier subunit
MNIEHRTPARIPVSISVHMHYYAILKERRGCAQEQLQTTARTGRELYDELSRHHGWTFPRDRFRLAINDEFRDWNTPLQDGDRVALIPPVAGGRGVNRRTG